MLLTNKFNLPGPVYQALARDDYAKGPADFSVTELFQPPQIRVLRKKHENDIQEDAIDRIWSLLGTSIHKILEGTSGIERLSEERYYTTFEGCTISGQADSYVFLDDLIQDWKLTSAWSILLRSRDDDWTKQLNAYAWLLGRPHYRLVDGKFEEMPLKPVKALQVVAFLRDWSKLEAKRNVDYPQKQIEIVDIPLFDPGAMDSIIAKRIHLHRKAEADIVEPCTPEEMWEKDTKYAVMKPGRERAIKLCASRSEAETWISMNMRSSEAGYVQERPGARTRCESYCNVAKFCPQYAAYLESAGKTPDDMGGML